jgi:hypothetical protein
MKAVALNGIWPEDARVGLIIFIESAKGILNLASICEAAVEISRSSMLVPQALVFGSDDFVHDIEAERSRDGRELVYARQKLVTAAKAFQYQAIDMVDIEYKDLDGLRKYCQEGASFGNIDPPVPLIVSSPSGTFDRFHREAMHSSESDPHHPRGLLPQRRQDRMGHAAHQGVPGA